MDLTLCTVPTLRKAIRSHLSSFGNVESVTVTTDSNGSPTIWSGRVLFTKPAAAVAALESERQHSFGTCNICGLAMQSFSVSEYRPDHHDGYFPSPIAGVGASTTDAALPPQQPHHNHPSPPPPLAPAQHLPHATRREPPTDPRLVPVAATPPMPQPAAHLQVLVPPPQAALLPSASTPPLPRPRTPTMPSTDAFLEPPRPGTPPLPLAPAPEAAARIRLVLLREFWSHGELPREMNFDINRGGIMRVGRLDGKGQEWATDGFTGECGSGLKTHSALFEDSEALPLWTI